jgi:methylglutaconyl-CoA hydratase
VSLVELSRRASVATITLADEARRNVLSGALMAELVAALDEVEADDAVRVVVVTNRGRVFCAGADLAEQSSDAPRQGTQDLASLLARVQRSAKPFVGRLAGHCVAGGVGLAAAFDISIALDTATFGFTEVRLGLAPAIISVVCLPKMRRGDALATFLRANRFPAAEAARLGLISAVADAEHLDDEIEAVVADLLAAPPGALAAAKSLVNQVPAMSIEDAFAWTSRLSADLFRGTEAREGMTAYLQKRPASWVENPATGD